MENGYLFHIDSAYTPKTIPMERLAEYMAALARLLGESSSVHFRELIDGSVGVMAAVEEPAQPKVRERIYALRAGTAPQDARRAFDELDDMLRRDNAYGALSGDAGAVIIPFPGKRRPEPVTFGPFRQDGSVDGQVYRIGGKDESKHVHIRTAKEDLSVLVASEEMALRLRHHLFGGVLRFHGTGTWFRHGNGTWELKMFRILDFEELDDAPLEEVISKLHAVPANGLEALSNPVARLLEDRRGEPH